MALGVDISRWQGVIDWCKVKATKKVDFAIIKIGGSDGSFYKDSQFENNYYGCKGHGIPCGAYFFLGADCNTTERGRTMGSQILSLIKPYKFEYPIYIDVEVHDKNNKQGNTNAVYACCDVLEKAGFYVGIYGSDINTFDEQLISAQLAKFDKWVARYPLESKCKYSGGLRQYSSTGKIDGINGNVDLNKSYYGFPQIMKTKHLNGF